ncbi:hypothetical protein CRE_12935 [Caenorhabditis remanei]|uniref:ZP domain-containing protein n=1 Tax=Caenorhabditis remanei TaxID=31234 RepID=E3N131_CAERE|nr:hypothetical protein CRE_12935 [Caenorhabditis remanei]
MRPVFPLFLVLFGPCLAVKPVWKTPVSEPNPNANVDELKGHSNVAKRAQPNYYTRPEQVSIPDYRSPRQRLPSSPIHQKYQQVPPHQITSGGSFRPFAWVGPQPKAGSPQTSYYEKAPNKGQFPQGLPPLPPNWQQYPVQMIWIPDTPGQTTGPYPYYPGPGPVDCSSGDFKSFFLFSGTLAHSPAVNPVTSTIPYEPPNPYGGRQKEVSPSSTPSDSGTYPSAPTSYPSTEDTTNPYEQSRSTGQDHTSSNNPTASIPLGSSFGKTVNPTIRPGPQEPSGGGGTTVKTRLPLDADETRDKELESNGRNSEKTKPTKATPIPTRPNSGNSGNTPSTRTAGIPATSSRPQDSRDKETTLFEMTTNPFGETIGGKTVPPIYLGSDEEDEEPPEDISKVTETPESSEHTQIPGSPGSQSTPGGRVTESPESSESGDDDRERETSSSETATPTPQEEEDEMMKNFFPRPVSSQAYQPPGHQPEDFTSHINVNFKKPKGKGSCVTPPCRGVDTDKISLYKPDRDNEGSGPTLVISNAAKDDASRAGYKPAPPPVNPYIPPPPPPHPEEEYATPYTVPPGKQPFPPFGGPATPPRALIPAHNFPPPSTFPPDEDYHETTADTIHPTAQTIATRFVAPTTTTTPRPVESTTTEEDTPEYVPPAIVHMTASTPRGKNPPTYVPLHPETSASTQNPTTPRERGETQTPASITRQPEFPSRATPPAGGNFPPGSTTTVSNPTTNGFITEVYTDRERTDSGESFLTSTPSSSNSETPSSGAFSTSSSTPAQTTTGGWIYTTTESSSTTTPESDYSTASKSLLIASLLLLVNPRSPPRRLLEYSLPPQTNLKPSPQRIASDHLNSLRRRQRLRLHKLHKLSPPAFRQVKAPPQESSRTPIRHVETHMPLQKAHQEFPIVLLVSVSVYLSVYIHANFLFFPGKPRILCLEDGISFEVKTILPLSGEVFANDRKRIPECQKTFTEDAKPKVFLPFSTCGVKNVGEQVDSRAQYHMQVVLIIDQGNGTNTLQSFMAQCVHQKVNYNKQVLPKRMEEALEELRLVPSKLEQKASMPSVQMQIVVDEGHHKLGAEVSAADIGMPLALKWSMVPESDAYGMHIRNCKVVDAVGKIDHTLIDEQGCSADLQIIDHPHYDTYHDTASAHMWAFKVPDMSSLQIKCDILICSNIKSSVTNTTSCEDIPSPPFCADVVTSPPNSILSDASSFIKHRRASVTSSEVSTSTQSVRTSICLSKTCRPDFSEEVRICVNTQLATTSTGLSVAFLLFAISFQIIARTKQP